MEIKLGKHSALVGFALAVCLLIGCGSGKQSEKDQLADTLTYRAHTSLLRAYDRLGSATFATNFYWWDSTGQVRELRESFGSVIFIYFWQTASKPSVDGLRDLSELQKKYRDSGLVVVGIPFKEPGTHTEAINRVVDLTASLQVDIPQILGTNELAATYGGIDAIPTTIIVNRKGQVRNTILGAKPKAVVEAEIREALTKN